jgi:hypothetical protein
MFRFLLIPLLCLIFAACSSDDSAIQDWFKDQGIATSYGKDSTVIEVLIKDATIDFDSSARMVSLYEAAVLGNVNGVEQMLYFGLEVLDALSSVWKLRTDSIFYKDIYSGKVPDEQKVINADFCWFIEGENKTQSDSLWLLLQNASSMECKPIENFEWKAGTSQDTFEVSLPKEFLDLRRSAFADTLRLLASIKLRTDNTVLRIAPPSKADIPGLRVAQSGLLRVAQKTIISDEECNLCLHSGVRESLSVAFEIQNEEDKTKMQGKTVVFAELVVPKTSDTTGSELGLPVPVLVSGEGYRVHTDYVEKYGHPNLVFWEGDSLKLQVTNGMRNYAISDSLPEDSLNFTLRLDFPMLNPRSPTFCNSYYYYCSEKYFAYGHAYARYNFSSLGEGKTAKLKLWFTDYGDKK